MIRSLAVTQPTGAQGSRAPPKP